MGCTFSHAQSVRPARMVPPLLDYNEEPVTEPLPTPTIRDLLRSDVLNITQGLKRLVISNSMRPVVVVGENSYPLVLSNFGFEDDIGQEITLPVIAISRVGISRIVFFGDYKILTDGTIRNNDFFENLLSWVTSFKYANKLKICLMGETQAAELSGYSVTLTNCDILPPPNTFDIIFTTNTVDADYNRLINSPNGAAIFYFGAGGIVNPIKDCGVSIVETSLKIKSTRFRPSATNELDCHTFQSVADSFITFLDQYEKNVTATTTTTAQDDDCMSTNKDDNKSTIDESSDVEIDITESESIDTKNQNKSNINILELDSRIISFRYYVRCIENYNEQCDSIAERCWNRLKSTNFRTIDGYYFPEIEQSLLAMILSETFPKVHPQLVTAAPYIKVPDVPVKNRKFHIPLRPNVWNFTGHYLLPGVVGTIKSDVSCTVQIGSNALQLFIKEGPWKRYPTITHRYSIQKDEEIEIASPFGGICYLLCDDSVSININMNNFAMYPCFSYKRPDLWSITCKYNDVPIGELSCKGITFVMPMEKMNNIKDKEKVTDLIGRLMTSTNSFVGPKLSRSHRVVFEIDMPNNEPIYEEVLYLPISDFDSIFNNLYLPTEELFLLISTLVHTEIDSAFLCPDVELTFAKVIAAAALNIEWEDNDISSSATIDNQKAYNVLLSIAAKYGYKPFAASLKEVLDDASIKTGYEAWDLFCSVFVRLTDIRLTEIENLFWEVRKLQGNVTKKLMDFILPEENYDAI